MRLAILGASGRIGSHLVNSALDQGHSVNVLARSPQALAPRGAGSAVELTVTGGDALDVTAVAKVIDGTDAVLSALGPRGAKTAGLLTGAAAAIADAMQQAGTRRLICVSAAGAFITEDPAMNPLVKLILPRIFARQFADVRGMEDTIRQTDLEWTLVRATRLVNSPLTGQYRVSPDYPPRGGGKISRADVAHFMTAALTGRSWIRGAPALAY